MANKGKKGSQHLFRGVTDFFSERSRMTDVMYDRTHESEARTQATAWAPLTDIMARDEDLIVRCEVPGVEIEDVDITFTNGVLEISGQRYTEQGEDNWGYYVRERYYGAFRRSISLPEGVGDDDIHAKFDNGLLVITVVGGATASASKKIDIAHGNTRPATTPRINKKR